MTEKLSTLAALGLKLATSWRVFVLEDDLVIGVNIGHHADLLDLITTSGTFGTFESLGKFPLIHEVSVCVGLILIYVSVLGRDSLVAMVTIGRANKVPRVVPNTTCLAVSRPCMQFSL